MRERKAWPWKAWYLTQEGVRIVSSIFITPPCHWVIAPRFPFGSFPLPNTCSLRETVSPHALHCLAKGWACKPSVSQSDFSFLENEESPLIHIGQCPTETMHWFLLLRVPEQLLFLVFLKPDSLAALILWISVLPPPKIKQKNTHLFA